MLPTSNAVIATCFLVIVVIGVVMWLVVGRLGEIDARSELEMKRAEIEKINQESEEWSLRVLSLRDRWLKRIHEIVSEHLAALQRKRQQCIYYDDYKKLCGVEKWASEVKYFRDKVIVPDEGVNAIAALVSGEGISRIIETNVFSELNLISNDGFDSLFDYINYRLDEEVSTVRSDVDSISGGEYEVHCADILEKSGWGVLRKGGAGDQGVDLVASLGQLRVAVQCKRYSQPVGNKAVQEVAAGRQFEQCDLALVVSNANYTPAARQLAQALGVMLLHHSDLEKLREIVEESFSALISGEATA